MGRFTTIEREWHNNIPRISCIPAASYRCVRDTFHRGGYPCFTILDVPGRSLIKFHRANFEENLLGCVGVGLGMAVLRGRDEDSGQKVQKLAVRSSRIAFDAWMDTLEGLDEFMLHIVGYEGEDYLVS